MVDVKDAELLNTLFVDFVAKLLRKAGNPPSEINSMITLEKTEGGVKDIKFQIYRGNYHAFFYISDGPELRVRVDRAVSNGLIEVLSKELDKVRTNTELRRSGHLEDRRVSYDAGYLEVDCRIKKIPEQIHDLFDYIFGTVIKPLMKLEE